MQRIGQAEIDAVTRAINSKNLFKIGGEEVFLFQEEMEKVFDTKNAIFMTSGQAALTSALVGMGIGPGDEVIVPGYTYIATAMAVVAAGAIPVIAEIDETLTLDASDVEKKITTHTKAVIPVHIQGFPCDMDALKKVCDKHNVMILEDACQADGGSFKGKRLGTIGDAGALSFNFFKIITAGEGGALFTDNKQIFERALIYHDSSAIAYFGNQLEGNDEEQFCGTEFRANEISAAILREQLKRMDGILTDLRRIKKTIMNALAGDFKFAPSHDIDGDCGVVVPFTFETAEEAIAFAEKTGGCRPYDTGKHVYKNWTAIMNKKGAFHPLMDPFKMEANKDIVPDYREDMCPKTLDILSRNVFITLNCDATDAEITEIIERCRNAKA